MVLVIFGQILIVEKMKYTYAIRTHTVYGHILWQTFLSYSVKELMGNILISSMEENNRVHFLVLSSEDLLTLLSFSFQLLRYCCLQIFLSSPRHILENKENQNVSNTPDINPNIHTPQTITVPVRPASPVPGADGADQCLCSSGQSFNPAVSQDPPGNFQPVLVPGPCPRPITGNFLQMEPMHQHCLKAPQVF